MVEYALILALIALIVIIALITTGNQLLNVYSNITATLCSYHVGCCSGHGLNSPPRGWSNSPSSSRSSPSS